jgi:hypothetical protein
VADLQSSGEDADRGLFPLRQASDRKQELMLLGLQSGGASRGLAEAQKTPDLVSGQ